MRVAHSLDLVYQEEGLPALRSEDLTFFHPLLVQQFVPSQPGGVVSEASSVQEIPETWRNSRLQFHRDASNVVTLRATPEVNSKNAAAYLRWFNLGLLEEHFRGERAGVLLEVLAQFARNVAENVEARDPNEESSPKQSLESFLDRPSGSPLSLAPELEALRRALTSIRRYDLQLVELRREQRPQLQVLSREGRGMPGAVKRLQDSADSTLAWGRIVNTMNVIAPHVLKTQIATPAPDKEFVEFIESQVGRAVESWEASDGTLRALATLVALERHPAFGTILIEEPEQGLHPWAVSALMEHIRDAINLRGLQVILTTHSQQVLEAIQPEELLVAERDSNEGTRFLTLDEILPTGSQISMGDVGRLWVKGLLKGVPSTASRDPD
jgi:hypothetical protein